jgi:hypothetical protein
LPNCIAQPWQGKRVLGAVEYRTTNTDFPMCQIVDNLRR